MKFTTITTVFALAISTVFAQNTTAAAPADGGVAVNLPARGDVWNAGTTQTVKFTMSDPSISTIEGIVLMGGDQGNLQTYLLVDTNVPTKDGQYSWNIPKNIQTMPSYALVFKTSKGSSYSPYFTIVGLAAGQSGAMSATSIDMNHLPSATSGSGASSSNGASSSGSDAKPSNAGDHLKTGFFGVVSTVAVAAVLVL